MERAIAFGEAVNGRRCRLYTDQPVYARGAPVSLCLETQNTASAEVIICGNTDCQNWDFSAPLYNVEVLSLTCLTTGRVERLAPMMAARYTGPRAIALGPGQVHVDRSQLTLGLWHRRDAIGASYLREIPPGRYELQAWVHGGAGLAPIPTNRYQFRIR